MDEQAHGALKNHECAEHSDVFPTIRLEAPPFAQQSCAPQEVPLGALLQPHSYRSCRSPALLGDYCLAARAALQAAKPADESVHSLGQVRIRLKPADVLKGEQATKQALVGGSQVFALLAYNTDQELQAQFDFFFHGHSNFPSRKATS